MEKFVKIITPTIDDWEKVKSLRLESLVQDPQAFGRAYSEEEKLPDSHWQEKISKAQSENSKNFLLVAETGKKLVGMIGACEKEIQGTWRIVDMFVDINYRGQKIGEELLLEILKKIKTRQGANEIEINANQNQTVAISLYKKHGFEVVGEDKAWTFGNGKQYDSLSMRKMLG